MPDTDDYGWDRPEYDDQALERYVRSLAHEKLIAAPGERFAYSNIAYEVLGLLIARASGTSFASPAGNEYKQFPQNGSPARTRDYAAHPAASHRG
jgi:hypothetical protein